MYFRSYKDVPGHWMTLFPSFSFAGDPNLYCQLTGAFFFHSGVLYSLQAYRDDLGVPVRVNSGHRSPTQNAMVGGAPLSQHLELAVDVSIKGMDKRECLIAAKRAGFTGLGLYNTFLHMDHGPRRMWYGSQSAKQAWSSIIARA